MIMDQNGKTEIRKIINSYSNEELIDKDFAFGVPTGLGSFPAESRLVDEMKKTMEMLNRTSRSQDKANRVMIALTAVLIILTVVLVVLTYSLI